MSCMNKVVKSLAAVLLTTAASHTLAQEYVGGNVAFNKIEIESADEVSMGGMYARLGTMYNDYLSAEARLGSGIGDDEIGSTTLELQSILGLYLRAGLPTGGRFYPYVAVGYTRGEVQAEGENFSINEAESSMSYGIGTDFHLNNSWDINAEYMQYVNKGRIEIRMLSVGAAYSF